jgi:hypothetical protein
MSFDLYPGGELVEKGLRDLEAASMSEEGLLLLVARPRLTALGIAVPVFPATAEPYEHALFSAIEERVPGGALETYNALIRRIVSFARAYESDH